jgi:hypothetical protein
MCPSSPDTALLRAEVSREIEGLAVVTAEKLRSREDVSAELARLKDLEAVRSALGKQPKNPLLWLVTTGAICLFVVTIISLAPRSSPHYSAH